MSLQDVRSRLIAFHHTWRAAVARLHAAPPSSSPSASAHENEEEQAEEEQREAGG